MIGALSGLFGPHAGFQHLGCVAFLLVCVRTTSPAGGQPLAGQNRDCLSFGHPDLTQE